MVVAMIKSALVLLAAGIIASRLRRKSAALRHAVWTAGLMGALAVPLLTLALPSLPVEWGQRVGSLFDAVAGSSVYIQRGVIAVWLAGVFVGMALLFYSALRLGWVAIRSEPVDDARWTALSDEVRCSLGIRRPVRLLQNRTAPFLGTWGIFVPRVLLPGDADGWSDERIKMVLGHELAHIQRHDWVVQVLADAARAIYWFNPFFWIASRRLRQESEHACDDAVVRMGAAGVQYAEELIEITRAVRSNGLRAPILAMAQPSHLEQRLVALLNPKLNRLAATPWAVFVVAMFAVGITLPLAAVRSPADAFPAGALPPDALPLNAKAPSAPPPLTTVTSPTAESQLPKASATRIARSPEASTAGAALGKSSSVSLTETASVATPQPEKSPAFECLTTPSSFQTKRSSLEKTALGNGPWLINEDRTMWVADQPYVAKRIVTTVWMRPAGVPLFVSGRRLDGEAPALEVRPVEPYETAYVAVGMTFPAPGCWEVTASAGDSKLIFITNVRD